MNTIRKILCILVSGTALGAAAPAFADRGHGHDRARGHVYERDRGNHYGHHDRHYRRFRHAAPPVYYEPRVVYTAPQVIYTDPDVVYAPAPGLGAVVGAVAGAIVGGAIGSRM